MNFSATQHKSLSQNLSNRKAGDLSSVSLRLCVSFLTFLAVQFSYAAQLHAQPITSKLQSRPLAQEIQLALNRLTRAELAQEETSLIPTSEQNFSSARRQCREVIQQLKKIDVQLTDLLKKTYRQKPSTISSDNWTSQELESLVRNLQVQLARAYRNQALCYTKSSPDQINSLSLALEAIQDVINLPLDDPTVWQARIEQVACLRLLQRTAQAQQQVTHWQQATPPAPYASRLFGEQLRIHLSEGRISEARKLIESHKKTRNTSPETDDAILEVLLAAQRTQQALSQLQHISTTHSTFWKQRAQLRIGLALAKQTETDDPELLDYTATSLYHAGKLQQAVAAYDRLAKLFAQQNKADQQFKAASTAAAITRKSNQPSEALERYRQLAFDPPEHAQAASAHWIAVGLAAELARAATTDQRGTLFERYRELLAEHLAKWPTAPTAKQALQWLTRTELPEIDRRRVETLVRSGEHQDALLLYRKILKDTPNDAQLLESFALLLSRSTTTTEQREALRVWQQIEQRSKPGGLRWIRARRARLILLEELGEGERAKKLQQLTEILYPGKFRVPSPE